MHAPEFWKHQNDVTAIEHFKSQMLRPCGWAYGKITAIKTGLAAKPFVASVPVICIGNLTVGGSGKTPTAVAVMERLKKIGTNAHFLTRGYGGRLSGPVQVDLARHTYKDVGDEALILAQTAPTWKSPDRVQGARSAIKAGAEAIVMDDGFQNPSLHKDLSLIVVDGDYGFGNGRMMPSGPLRESLSKGIKRAKGFILIGDDRHCALDSVGIPVIKARTQTHDWADILKQNPVMAFAGMGRPQKFFDAIVRTGGNLITRFPFPDHFAYDRRHLQPILDAARGKNAIVVTTEKDMMRVPVHLQGNIHVLPLSLDWDDPDQLDRMITATLDTKNRSAR